MPDRTVLVLAGNYREYLEYVRERQGDRVRYFYARNTYSFFGLHPDGLAKTETFWDREDALDISWLLVSNKYKRAKAEVRTPPGSEPQPE